MAHKRIAVVGGGFTGIGCCSALKESGLEPICFEWTDKPGGTWCYRESSEEGLPSLMKSTIINHSKEIGALSNFPPRKEYNNFMRHKEMYHYLMEIATERDLLKHIHCNSKVTEVTRAEDYDDTGRWVVTVKNMLTGVETTDIYDGCLICVGHLNRPKMPTYPGQEKFKGKIMHTHNLKKVDEFKDKNVVVVGMGCSGLDAAVESSNVAKQVYLSTTSGGFVINRVGRNGRPNDLSLLTRFNTIFITFSHRFASWMLEGHLDQYFHHTLYRVQPKHHVLEKDPVANDFIFSKILSGSVIQTKGIKYFTETGVVFEGETNEVEADVVIMATGYSYGFPFLEQGILKDQDGIFNLYKCIFPTHLPHATLAFVAFILPYGPGFPIVEMQWRYVAHALSTDWKLPSKERMEKDIMDRYNESVARYGKCDQKSSLRMDILPYMDDLASEIGVKPNFFKMFFTDIRLFLKLMFGPFYSYQYRLEGPHKWEGARDAIMTAEERICWPIRKRNGEPEKENFILKWIKIFLLKIINYAYVTW